MAALHFRVFLKSDPQRWGKIVSGPFLVQGVRWWNVLIDGRYGRHPETDLEAF